LKSLGYVLGVAQAVVGALIAALGSKGTLVMPAFTPQVSDPSRWKDRPFPEEEIERVRAALPAFDIDTTPTSMGAIAETFRRWPGAIRSDHPQVSVCAHGPMASMIVAPHELAWAQGPGSPFERLYDLGANVLLLGVGFNRATMLHYAESRTPCRRVKTRLVPLGPPERRKWVEVPDVADDLGVHFPAIGAAFLAKDLCRTGKIAQSDALLVPGRDLVDFAADYFLKV
jgi:aminoglycoside 3-N-acetyltransferase